MVPRIVRRWYRSGRNGLDMTVLQGRALQAPAANATLRQRLNWLGSLIEWVGAEGTDARLKRLLQACDHNPELKIGVAESLRSIIGDTRALELFMNVGIPNQQDLLGEFSERLSLKFLPQPPHDQDLISVFSETFCGEADAEWIRQTDPAVFQSCLDLFHHSENALDGDWNSLVQDARDALYLLSHSVRSVGLSRLIRNRASEPDFRKFPFFMLTDRADALLHAPNDAARIRAYVDFKQNLDGCFAMVDEVHWYFRDHGATLSLVYQLERLQALMTRTGTLAKLLAGYPLDPRFIQEFLSLLIQESYRARSLRGLLKDNLVLISQKIVETNAEAGEHYITRDRSEYLSILKKSWGGGVVTGFTTLVKFLLYHLSAPPFVSGFFAFANYSVSFIGIQLLGFTLATKQPAMTATALASKIPNSDESDGSENSVEALVDEIIHLIRSQLAAVAGNLAAVVPVVVLIEWALSAWGFHLTDAAHAEQAIESFSVLGMTPFYAAWTGVLLWASSVFAGWMGNWFNFRRLPEAIEHHSRLIFLVGSRRAKRIAEFLRSQVAGFSASLSLAFFLGMTPQIALFFGIPLDVRHVTLSSGALTAAVLAIGPSLFSGGAFWLAVAGIASMAVLNLAVSFVLALNVAIWARRASALRSGIIYRAFFKKILRKPWVLLFPLAREGV